MDFVQAMDNLRSRLREAREKSLEGGFEMAEQMMEQVATEAEKFRKECIRQAESLEAQARACKWQAESYSAIAAMCYRVFNGFVSAEEKRQAEMAAVEAENREKAELAAKAQAEQAESPPKKRLKKPAE